MSLWKKSANYAVGRIIGSVISLAALPILTRVMSPYEFGLWQVAGVFASLFIVFSNLGMDQALFRYYLLSPDRSKVVIGTSFISVAAFSTIGITIAIVFASSFSSLFLGLERNDLLILTALWGAADAFFLLALSVFQAQERTWRYVFYDNLRAGVGYATAIVLAALGFGAQGVITGWTGTTVIIVIFSALSIILMHSHIGFDTKLWRQMLAYGFPIAINLVAIRVFTMTDRWLIARLMGYDYAGIYSASAKVAGIVSIALMPVRTAWVARMFYMHKQGTLVDELPDIWRQLAGGLGIITCAVSLLPYELLSIFAGWQYLQGYVAIPFLAVAFFMDGLVLIADTGVYIKGKTAIIPVFTIISALANILLNLLWIPRWGILGAAVASAISYSTLAFLYWRVGQSLLPVKIPYISLALSIVAIGVSIWIGLTCEVLIRVISLAILSTALIFLSKLDKDIWRALKNWKNKSG